MLKYSLGETKVKNKLLTRQLAQKDMDISHLKSEVVSANQGRVEMCLDAETEQKLNNYRWNIDQSNIIERQNKPWLWKGQVTESMPVMKDYFWSNKIHIIRNLIHLPNKLNTCMTILLVAKNKFCTVKCLRCNYVGHVEK